MNAIAYFFADVFGSRLTEKKVKIVSNLSIKPQFNSKSNPAVSDARPKFYFRFMCAQTPSK